MCIRDSLGGQRDRDPGSLRGRGVGDAVHDLVQPRRIQLGVCQGHLRQQEGLQGTYIVVKAFQRRLIQDWRMIWTFFVQILYILELCLVAIVLVGPFPPISNLRS